MSHQTPTLSKHYLYFQQLAENTIDLFKQLHNNNESSNDRTLRMALKTAYRTKIEASQRLSMRDKAILLDFLSESLTHSFPE